MTPKSKRLWRTSCPIMVFPANSLTNVIELLRAYIGVMTAPYDIIVTNPKGKKWKLVKGTPLERKYCVRLTDEDPDPNQQNQEVTGTN
jgi:hypothetical protein